MEPPKPPLVQIIENRSRVTGIVQRIEPQTELANFVRLMVQVEAVRPVASFAELLAAQQPTTVAVLARQEHLPANLAGQRVEMTVRMAPLTRLFLQDDSVTVLGPAPR